MLQRLLFVTLTIYLVACNPARPLTRVQKVPIDIDSVVQEVARQYNRAKNDLSNGFGINLQIKEASVTVKVTNGTSGGIDLQLLVFKLSHKQKFTKASTLTFALEQVKPAKSESPGMAIEPLSTLIIEAARKFNEISTANISDLQKDHFEIDISFIVERETNGTIAITPTLANDANVNLSRSVEHDLKLVFSLKK